MNKQPHWRNLQISAAKFLVPGLGDSRLYTPTALTEKTAVSLFAINGVFVTLNFFSTLRLVFFQVAPAENFSRGLAVCGECLVGCTSQYLQRDCPTTSYIRWNSCWQCWGFYSRWPELTSKQGCSLGGFNSSFFRIFQQKILKGLLIYRGGGRS